jgi:hypothetical protein
LDRGDQVLGKIVKIVVVNNPRGDFPDDLRHFACITTLSKSSSRSSGKPADPVPAMGGQGIHRERERDR